MEREYDFKKRMLEVHKPHRKNDAVWTKLTGTVLTGDWEIVFPRDAGRVLTYAARDFTEYLNVSLDIWPRLRTSGDIAGERHGRRVILATAADFPHFAQQNRDAVENPRARALAYRLIITDDDILVVGASERGCAQGVYRLEDILNANEGPVISPRDESYTPLFSPRMTHSGYELDTFPDNVLRAIAHQGMDAIKVFTKGVNMTEHGYQDFNELIWRAAGFGLDVYCYSYYKSEMHPSDPGAREYYDNLYGELFRACPGFRGVIFVGESIGFPSHDPHTHWDSATRPKGKFHPGWYPCEDYPEWIAMVSGVIHTYAPECEIVFWTYNWGFQPEDARLALIRKLPRDITLLVTYEMFELREVAPGVIEKCADYTLGFEGPGGYFLSEAKAAHECGIRLYTMCNTGGLTWDVGDIPYLPTPQQWNRRYQGILRAHDLYGLCGLMESHHYGFVPSFVSELCKTMYTRVDGISPDFDTELRKIAVRDFTEVNADTMIRVWDLWSEGLRHIVTEGYDQYGPLRIGPSFPLTFDQTERIPTRPYASHHTEKNIVTTTYFQDIRNTRKVLWELETMTEMGRLFREGGNLMETVLQTLTGDKLTDARRQYALGRFIERTAYTHVNNKRWHILKCILLNETGAFPCEKYSGYFEVAPREPMPEGASHDRAGLLPALGLSPTASDTEIAAEMERVAREELANTRATYPLIMEDSRIGFEPTMDYMADARSLDWKRRVTEDSLARLRAWKH